MFYVRKLLEALLSPLSIIVYGLIAGLIAQRRGSARVRLWGTRLLIASVTALACLAYGLPLDSVARMLETKYPALEHPEALSNVKWVVVLGGGTEVLPGQPVTSYPRDGSMYRIAEGVRVYRAIPGSRISFSGYSADGSMSAAQVGRAVAISLGVAVEDIVTDDRPKTTSQEAEFLKNRIGGDPFVLVTSALHMPRAVMLFRRFGMAPIPAPTGHLSETRHSFDDWITPSSKRIVLAGATWHELLGMAFATVRP